MPKDFNELLSYVAGGLSSGASAYAANTQMKDLSSYKANIDAINEASTQYDDADSLMASYNAYTPAYQGYTADDLGISSEDALRNTALAGISGVISANDPLQQSINGGIGILGSLAGWGVNRYKAKQQAEELNARAAQANNLYLRNFNNNAGLVKDSTFNKAALNLSAFGGQLDSFTKSRILTKSFKMKPRKLRYGGCGKYFAYGGDMSGDWTNNVTLVNAGQTHEKNPYGGVFVGTDAQGTPNLVEEGEVIFNDYVYSNRLKPTEKQLEDVKLDTKLKGKTYAEIAMELQKDSAIRPLDPISKNTLVDSMSKLTSIQEETRTKKAERELNRLMQSMTPEQEMLMQQMAEANPVTPEEAMPQQEEQEVDENGNPRAYRDIRNQMDESLLNGEYAFGGKVNIGEDGLELHHGKIGSSLPYSNDMNGFVGYKDGRYTPAYLDWLKNLKFDGADYDLFNELNLLYYEYFPNKYGLTKEEAIKLGQDNKRGSFHPIFERAYADYLNRMKNPSLAGVAETQPKNSIIGKQSTNNPVEETQPKNSIIGKQSTNNPVEESGRDILQNNNLPPDSLLRYAPVVGSLYGMMVNNEPDYSNSDLIARGRRGIRDVRARTIGNYLTYNPYDVNYERNKAQQLGLATQRGILNASNNRSAAMAGLLAQQGNMANAIGDIYDKALKYNNTQRSDVATFNRATNQANMSALNQVDQFNSGLDSTRAGLFEKEATMRNAIDAQSSAAKSSAYSSFFNNLGKVGESQDSLNWRNWLLANGYIPNYGSNTTTPANTSKNGGKIRRRKKRLLR